MEEKKQEEIISGENISAISVQSRLLPFWREYPRAWFIQFEAVVDPLKTSDDQKFRYVLQQLQSSDLQHLTDILYQPPAVDKYQAVKTRLLAAYEKSDVKNFQKLISGLELGDQKPSQLLRKMRELSSGMVTDEGLRIEWLNQLPTQVRVVLSVNTEAALDTLAAMADKMLEYTERPNISAVSSSSATTSSTQYEALAKQIENLTLEVAELRRGRAPYRQYRRPFHSRSRSHSRLRKTSKVKPGDATWECKYHFRFGEENPVADALSRLYEIDCPTTIDYEQLSADQHIDEELKLLKKQPNLKFREPAFTFSDTTVSTSGATNTVRGVSSKRTVPEQPYTTRSGRIVKKTVRFS
ncbi:unnamed protein product [Danaus chrysippus]|uniref:(African queen) hypothetical protein n=1 Tax=Danaus chrysippus TaxID=151541 RepID=A0A8J2R1E4_9NEOP|nr:unnamed protein product [Danaus chrysippus]